MNPDDLDTILFFFAQSSIPNLSGWHLSWSEMLSVEWHLGQLSHAEPGRLFEVRTLSSLGLPVGLHSRSRWESSIASPEQDMGVLSTPGSWFQPATSNGTLKMDLSSI
jgi:hypothetical protein